MKETIYKYSLRAVLAIAVGFSAFLISSDNIAPFTTQATVHSMVTAVAPEVSGVVTSVNVTNGEFVHAGDVLFSIDSSSYSILANKAKAEFTRATEMDSAAVQSLLSAQDNIAIRKEELANASADVKRIDKLHSKNLATTKELDDSRLALALSRNNLNTAIIEYKRLNAVTHGSTENSDVKIALANLESANLNLERTDVTASTDGIVTSLQLHQGTYVSSGERSLYLVDKSESWVSADFNEKGMDRLAVGTPVRVVFDAIPGKVFTGHITSQDAAVYDEYNPTNQMAIVGNDNHWIREQQKIRTRITVPNLDPSLISGARATVMVEVDNGFIDAIGATWMQLVSTFRYIY